MIVSAIAAMSRTGVIGDGIKMPWHLPRSLRRFRDSTMGKPVDHGTPDLGIAPRPAARSTQYRPVAFGHVLC